ASLSGLKEWVRNNRSRPLKELAVTLRRKFTGYFNYYGVIGNTTLNQHEKRISGWCILTRKIVVHFNPQNDKEITSLVADRNGSPFESTYFYAKQTAIQEISILFLAFGLALVIAHVLMDRFSPLKKRSQNQTR
ncbi:MAG TPA: hypothetical protein VJ952_10375, partial [Opitutales bacterium]|nr:hypothetical protein [Opitutales bacterium]